MRIVCPSCSAAYEVADSLVIPGRIVRCARCSQEWVALTVEAPAVDDPEPEVPPEYPPDQDVQPPRLSAMDRLAQAEPTTRGARSAALRAAWAVSIVLLAGLLWGAYAWRGEVMAGWPPSIRLYSAVGLAASGR